jgi:integrase
MGTLELCVDGIKLRVRARRGRRDGKWWWVADLRAAGFREHSLGIEATDDEASRTRAVAAATALLSRYRRGGTPEGGQIEIPGTGNPGTFGAAADAALKVAKRERKPETYRWIEEHTTAVCRALGIVALADLEWPHGNALLERWTALMLEKLSPHTVVHRHSQVRRVLAHAKRQGWLARLPEFPRAAPLGVPIYVPTCRPISQAHYELVRGAMLPKLRAKAARGDARALADLEDRLLYLDFVRYTGGHKHDADTLKGEHVSVEFNSWCRRNLKNEHKVEPLWIDMNEPLRRALQAKLDRCGGYLAPDAPVVRAWEHPTREIANAARALGVPAFTLLDLRCTVATELAVAGVPEHVAVSLLGHTSSLMIRTVYRKVPRAQLSLGMQVIGKPVGPGALGAVSMLAHVKTQSGDAEVRKPPRKGARVASASQNTKRNGG